MVMTSAPARGMSVGLQFRKRGLRGRQIARLQRLREILKVGRRRARRVRTLPVARSAARFRGVFLERGESLLGSR